VKGRNILMEPEREATLTYVQRVPVQIKKKSKCSFKYFISKSSYIVGSNRVIIYIEVTEKTLVV
jgi:flagellar biogenesis protein FliO